MLAADVALVRLDDPLAVVALDVCDFRLLVDLGTVGTRALRKGHGDVDRRDMPVGRMPERAHQPVHRGERPELLDLVDADQMALDPDGLRRALIVPILIHPVAITREPQVTGVVEADSLSGLLFKRLVKLDRILMQLPHAVGHVEERQEAGSVPGGAGGKFGAFQENDVRPPLLGEMIKHRDAANAAADHHHARTRFHRTASPRLKSSGRFSN